jgi:hypothetical protein
MFGDDRQLVAVDAKSHNPVLLDIMEAISNKLSAISTKARYLKDDFLHNKVSHCKDSRCTIYCVLH